MACAMMAMEPQTDLTLTDQLQKLNLTELTLIINTFQSFLQLITMKDIILVSINCLFLRPCLSDQCSNENTISSISSINFVSFVNAALQHVTEDGNPVKVICNTNVMYH